MHDAKQDVLAVTTKVAAAADADAGAGAAAVTVAAAVAEEAGAVKGS